MIVTLIFVVHEDLEGLKLNRILVIRRNRTPTSGPAFSILFSMHILLGKTRDLIRANRAQTYGIKIL